MGDLEAAALSGNLFRPRSVSPARSISSTSSPNTDDGLGSDISGPSIPPLARDGPQTGPKGVIEDRRAHNLQSRTDRDRLTRETRADQERRKIVVLTLEEEGKLREREKLLEDEEDMERWRRKRRGEMEAEKLDDGGGWMKRGGLREIGKEGFVRAVERPGRVVVLIYEPDVPRCLDVLTSLLRLSLSLSSSTSKPISLFRARARNLAFSLLPDGEPDLDVLPTMLAYRDGELEKTWIRVDWEVGEDGVEELLKREGILPDGDGLNGFALPNLVDESDEGE